jgi:putative endonuclease
MHYGYILRSKMNGSLYIGTTDNLSRRIEQHNAGMSASTKRYMPWEYIYFEDYAAKDDALTREHNLKYHGRALAQLKARLRHSLPGARLVRS